MRKMQGYVVKGNKIFIRTRGFEEDVEGVLCDWMVIDETGIPAKYEAFQAYLLNKYPDCGITVMYEAGFQGCRLRDLLEAED